MNGQFELTVEAAGVLALTAGITAGLQLVPGDLFFLSAEQPGVLHLEIYHEILADNWEALSPVNRWRYLEKFLRRPQTALSPTGDLAIPEDLFPLRKGESVWLWIARLGPSHKLLLFKKDANDHRTRNGDQGDDEAAGSVLDASAPGGLRGPVRPLLVAKPFQPGCRAG